MTTIDFAGLTQLMEDVRLVAAPDRRSFLQSKGTEQHTIDIVLWAIENQSELAGDSQGIAGLQGAVLDAASAVFEDLSPELPAGLEVLRQLGRGGGGTVWLAKQVMPPRLVAVKVLDPRGVGTLRSEIEVLAELEHPGIVRIHQVGECTDGVGRKTSFMAMELVRGETISCILMQARATPRRGTEAATSLKPDALGVLAQPGVSLTAAGLDAWLRVFLQVADALAYAHAKGVVHGDIKPANIMVRREDGRPVLLDFGLAATPGEGEAPALGMTIDYAAPEILRRGAPTSESDVWSLGVVIFEALCGRHPFGGPMFDHRVILPDPRRDNSAIDRNLALVIETALDPDPRRRYPSARAFADDLASVLARRPIRGRDPGLWERTRLAVRRRPVVVLVCAILVAAGGIIAGLHQARRAKEGQRLFAESTLRYQEGRWNECLNLARRAEATGGVSVLDIGSRIADARICIGEIESMLEWAREAAVDPEPALRAKAQLLLGDFEAGSLEERRRLLESARDSGHLVPGDARYVVALLAPDVPSLEARLAECLARDPSHARAQWAYVLALVLMGKLEEAEQRVRQLEYRWPTDPQVREVLETIAVLKGEDSNPENEDGGSTGWEKGQALNSTVVVREVDRALRVQVRKQLDGSHKGPFEALLIPSAELQRLAVLLKEVSLLLGPSSKEAVLSSGSSFKMPFPLAWQNLLERLVRWNVRVGKHAPELHALLPIGLFSQLEGAHHWKGRRFAEARRCFVRSLEERDPLLGLTAVRARSLIHVCFGEQLDAKKAGQRRLKETQDALRLGIHTFLRSAGSFDLDAKAYEDLSYACGRLNGWDEALVEQSRPSVDDLGLHFEVLTEWRRDFPEPLSGGNLDLHEARLFFWLGSPLGMAPAKRFVDRLGDSRKPDDQSRIQLLGSLQDRAFETLRGVLEAAKKSPR